MIGRTNTGGGGVGGVLTVTTPAGVTVSVSKDGKVKTKTANAEGLAVFKGLKTGTWQLTITDGSQVSTKPVVITADYSTVIAFFMATISITYPAGSTCTCSDGVTTLTAPDTSGTWKCIVPNAGTWTVSITDGTDRTEEVVEITADGQSESMTLSYITYVYDYGWMPGVTTSLPVKGSGDGGKTVTVTYIDGKMIFNRTSWNGMAAVTTSIPFDLTNTDTVYCKTGNIGNGIGKIYLGIGNANDVEPVCSVELTKSDAVHKLPIADYSGSYVIGFYHDGNGGSDWTWTNREIVQIYYD